MRLSAEEIEIRRGELADLYGQIDEARDEHEKRKELAKEQGRIVSALEDQAERLSRVIAEGEDDAPQPSLPGIEVSTSPPSTVVVKASAAAVRNVAKRLRKEREALEAGSK